MTGAGMVESLGILAGTVGILFLLTVLRRPLRGLGRLCARTGAGLCALAVFAPVGGLFGAGLGVNLFNALVLGVLGAPGFGLLLMLKWVLRIP